MADATQTVWEKYPFDQPPPRNERERLIRGSNGRMFNYGPGYAATTDDLHRLSASYPDMDAQRPDWQRIRVDLIAAGVMPSELKYITSADLVAMAYGRIGTAEPSSAASASLNQSEQDIVSVLCEAGHRMTKDKIIEALAARGLEVSEGTTKTTLAAMVRHRVLDNRSDATPRGYGLLAWRQS